MARQPTDDQERNGHMEDLTGSTQAVVGPVIVLAAVIVVVFVVLKLIAFIQRIWRE
jgi:hypothetical protein